MGKRQTSARWLNEVVKSVTRCKTKEASRRATVIKLALHHGIHVADFPAFFALRGNEEQCVAEYKELMRRKSSSAPPDRQVLSADDLSVQVPLSPSHDTEGLATHSAQPLLSESEKLVAREAFDDFKRYFTLVAGNREVASQLEAALLSGSKRIVGSRYNLKFMADKYGITALKVSR